MVRSPTGLGLKTTGAGGSSVGGWPTRRKVLLILTQSCWPLSLEYWLSEGWVGAVCAARIQCSRWGSLSLRPYHWEETPNICRIRHWASEAGSRGTTRV